MSEDYRKVLETLDKIPVDTEENFINTLKSTRSSRWVKKVSRLIKNGSVEKHVFKPSGKTVWIVVGKEKDYLILPEAEFCTCDDFYFRVMDHEVHLCYHLLAQKLADLLGLYEKIEESDEIYETLMKEWKEITNK